MNRIAIIDYGMGNHFSVHKKMKQLGTEVISTNLPDEIASCDKLILPGVGHFGKAMENLKKMNLIDLLNEEVLQHKKPILGICLGMQLMANESEEGHVGGLGWFEASVTKFNIQNKLKFKIPHTGWNQIEIAKPSRLLNNIAPKAEFYFVHAYHFNCEQEQDVLCYTHYETPFISAIEKDNIFGVQFHPEKSHETGLTLLKNFVEL